MDLFPLKNRISAAKNGDNQKAGREREFVLPVNEIRFPN
jgi:hypothetical protein